MLNELPIERKQIIRRLAAGVGWGKIARAWGTRIKIKDVQLEYQLACRYLCKRILNYSESLGFKNEKYLSKREGSFYEEQILSPKWRQLKGYSN